MFSLFCLPLVAAMFTILHADEVCYEYLGCFSDDYPYSGSEQRPIAKLPWPPEKINTRFLLFTRQNPSNWQQIEARHPATINSSNFEETRQTAFIVHGFIDKGDDPWLEDICREMLSVDDVNCICVDWVGGSRTFYSQAVNNLRVAAAEGAFLISVMQDMYGYTADQIYLVGHSLGAHIAGEIGKRIPGIKRITGMDPAGPFFQNCDPLVRLDPSDAVFVDAIHTDAAPMIPNIAFGMKQPVGHVDFYPNGGEEMPGCEKNTLSTILDIDGIREGTRNFFACNHLRSYKYYTETIQNAGGFMAYPCDNYDDFTQGKCVTCPDGGCPRMGYLANTYAVTPGVVNQLFYLNTGAKADYSRWRYEVSVTLEGLSEVDGTFRIALYGPNGNTREHQMPPYYVQLIPGETYTYTLDAEIFVGEPSKVKFLWQREHYSLFSNSFGVSSISVVALFNGNTYIFCGSAGVQVYQETLLTSRPC
uniref:pancreatic lipase-related protein 2-like n=1 Tax=Myxine glutinosa TaxID=7769 RepID=UPI00358F8262